MRGLREQGVPVIHVSSDPDVYKNFGTTRNLKDTDLYEDLLVYDGQNLSNIVKALKAKGVKNVIPGSEFGVEFTYQLRRELGLPSVSEEVAKLWRSKSLQQIAVGNAGLNHIKGFLASSRDETLEKLRALEISYPIIVKADNGAGTVGMREVRSKEELDLAFSDSNFLGKARNGNPNVLVQEIIHGPEYAVNGVVSGDNIIFSETVRYEKVYVPQGAHVYRSVINVSSTEGDVDTLEAYVRDVLYAVKMKEGAFHAEVKIDPARGPVLIEVANRMMGASFPRYLKEVYPASQLDLLILRELNPELFAQLSRESYRNHENAYLGFVALIATDDGMTIKKDEFGDFLSTLNSYRHHAILPDKTERTVDLDTMPGYVVLTADTLPALHSDMEAIYGFEQNLLYRRH